MDAGKEEGHWLEAMLRGRIGAAIRHRGLASAVAVSVVAVAIIVLHRFASEVPWHEVKADIASFPAKRLLLAAACTVLSFAALASYDPLALQIVAPGRVPRPVAAATGAGGYAISNLLGLGWLTGGALRFRIYSAFGLEWTEIAGVIATSWVSFWLGVLALLGLAMTGRSEGLGAALGFPPIVDAALGALILTMIVIFFGWISLRRRDISVLGFRLRFATPKLALAQSAAGMLDILGAALTLYVLLPADLTQNFVLFFIVYLSAVGLGILSHSPGGIGVLEATVIAGLGAGGRSDVLAALALFRLIYYAAPFALAVTGIGAAFALANRRHAGKIAIILFRVLRPVVPPVAAGIALLSGAILLASGSLPAETSRLDLIRDALPLPLIEASHFIGSIAGVLLIIVANGLHRKQRRAWFAACCLATIGIVASLLKGLDWEEAITLAGALGLLLIFRSAFYRSSADTLLHPDWRWLLAGGALVASAIWVGLFAYSHVPYTNDLWWHFAWSGDAPRFLRASLAAAVVIGAIGLNTLLTARPRPLPPEPIPDHVRALVAASPFAEANIALTGDKRFLLSGDGRAFIAYADTGASLIAKGDPVGAHDAGEEVIWKLRELADRLGKRCAFYAVMQAYLPTYLDMGLSVLKIGEVATVDLTGFSLEGSSKRDLRQALARSRREGYRFEIIAADKIDAELPALRALSEQWLATKQGEEKRFALGAFAEAYMRNFDCAVLRHAATGRIVAFANLFQGAARHELSLDLMRYAPDGPKFAMDALFAALMLWGKSEGFHWFSLGAAPLSGLRDHPLATIWSRIGSYIYRHGEHFYHFEGLRSFKEKFGPVWAPVYLASPHGLSAPLVLYEVNALISGGVAGLLR